MNNEEIYLCLGEAHHEWEYQMRKKGNYCNGEVDDYIHYLRCMKCRREKILEPQGEWEYREVLIPEEKNNG